MANFRTTADYVKSILQLAGEPTSGSSGYQDKALEHLNSIHRTIIKGGNEFNVEVDEVWPWAVDPYPVQLKLEAPLKTTGSVSNNSTLAFITAPTDADGTSLDLTNWYIKFDGHNEVYRVDRHATGLTTLGLSSAWLGATTNPISMTVFKLDYELVPNTISVRAGVNDTIYFAETTAKTLLTEAIAPSTYSISSYISTIAAEMTAEGASTYTGAYDNDTRKYTITSDGAGGDNVFYLIGDNALEQTAIRQKAFNKTIGLGVQDVLGTTVSGNTSKIESEIPVGATARIIAPIMLHTSNGQDQITGMDIISLGNEYPIVKAQERDPDRFALIDETAEGIITIRLNSYPTERRLMDVYRVPMPVDLYNTTGSLPLVPRDYSKVLEYGAAAYLLMEKEDTKFQQYFQLAGQVLQAMMTNNRKNAKRMNPRFAETVAREDKLSLRGRRRLRYGYTAGNY